MLSGFPQRPTTNIDGNNNEIGAYIYGYRRQTSLGYWGRVARDEKLIKLRVKRFEVSNSIGFRDFGLTSHTTKKLLPMTENAFLSSTLYQRLQWFASSQLMVRSRYNRSACQHGELRVFIHLLYLSLHNEQIMLLSLEYMKDFINLISSTLQSWSSGLTVVSLQNLRP